MKTKLYVVTASLLDSETGEPRRCYNEDGKASEVRRNWAKFGTDELAEEFTEKNGIQLDNEFRKIVLIEFEDIEN
jgi:hypothetical protein